MHEIASCVQQAMEFRDVKEPCEVLHRDNGEPQVSSLHSFADCLAG